MRERQYHSKEWKRGYWAGIGLSALVVSYIILAYYLMAW
jgi:hypothetical protein